MLQKWGFLPKGQSKSRWVKWEHLVIETVICYTGLMTEKVISQNSRKWTALSVDQGEKKMKSILWSFWDLTAFVFQTEKAALGWDSVQCHLLKKRLFFVKGASMSNCGKGTAHPRKKSLAPTILLTVWEWPFSTINSSVKDSFRYWKKKSKWHQSLKKDLIIFDSCRYVLDLTLWITHQFRVILSEPCMYKCFRIRIRATILKVCNSLAFTEMDAMVWT